MTTTEPVRALERWMAAYGGPDAAVATLLCDRHRYSDPALTVVRPGVSTRTYSYAGLGDMSGRFARVLSGLGIGVGDRVATLLPRGVEVVAAALGIWRLGAVHVPLSTALGTAGIGYRLENSGARVVVTDSVNRFKLHTSEDVPADAGRRIVTVGGGPLGDIDFWSAVDAACDPVAGAVAVGGSAPFLQLYTSGTTGNPKPVAVPVKALASFEAYLKFGLDLRADDIYWNAADPGWAYGLYYAVVGPLLVGMRTILLAASFDAELAYRVLRDQEVTNFAATPTGYRALMAAAGRVDLSGLRLRALASSGEPLGADLVDWASTRLGLPIRDHYGQTETGMIVNNHAAPSLAGPPRPGSMGTQMPGFEVRVLAAEEDRVAPAGAQGRLAVDVAASPLFWFEGYHNAPERTVDRFSARGRYYLTGDLAVKGDDGYFTFSSRADLSGPPAGAPTPPPGT